MSRILLIIFSLNLFSSGVVFSEIAKLPALAEHYWLHKQEKLDTTMLEFLWLHYFDTTHQNDSSHNHDSLPFHQHYWHTAAPLICSLPTPSQGGYLVLYMVHKSRSITDFYYCRYLPVGFVGSLFQPPRV